MKEEEIVEAVTEVVLEHLREAAPLEIPVGISSRHVHLSQEDMETLFGKTYQLTRVKDLSQPGEFLAAETLVMVGPKAVIEKLSVVGPLRRRTQVEISRTDAFRLGVAPPVRDSGDLEGTPGVILVGPRGAVALPQGVVLAQRHIHMIPEDARRFGVADKDVVRVQVVGERGLVFDNVVVRVSDNYKLEMHIDTDEANAAMLNNGDRVRILPPRSKG